MRRLLHESIARLSVWTIGLLSACHAGSVMPGESVQDFLPDNLATEDSLHRQDARNFLSSEPEKEMRVVCLDAATPTEEAIAQQQLSAQGAICRDTHGRWNALWLSCACPTDQIFIADRGCAPMPPLMLAHAGCEGPRSEAPTACFRHIRLGPLMFDLNFQQARRLLPILRGGSETQITTMLLENGRTTLPDETLSDVRLHQTHRLKENIAGFALATEPWSRVDPPHYISMAPANFENAHPRKKVKPSKATESPSFPGMKAAAAAELGRVARETQKRLVLAGESPSFSFPVSFRVNLAFATLRRTLHLSETMTKNVGRISCAYLVTLRDNVPLVRVLRCDFGHETGPEQSGILEMHLSPTGETRASLFRFSTAGPATSWHLFDAHNKPLTKQPVRTLVNPEQNILVPSGQFFEKPLN